MNLLNKETQGNLYSIIFDYSVGNTTYWKNEFKEVIKDYKSAIKIIDGYIYHYNGCVNQAGPYANIFNFMHGRLSSHNVPGYCKFEVGKFMGY